MKRIALVAVAVTALASTWTATAAPEDNSTPESTRPPAPPARCTIGPFRVFAAEVWAPQHWQRRHVKPKASTLASKHRRLTCARPGHRTAMLRTWRRDKRAFLRHRRAKLDEQHYHEAVDPPGLATLEGIAACESGGDPGAISPSGTYRGKYQFDYGTWESVGGTGDPAAAPEREQDERAAELYRRAGPSPWPVCGI